jgi:DNA-binding NtrC family response regulator
MNHRVLLVDDDRALCETLEDGLIRRDLVVTWCTSSDEALSMLDQRDFDVIVTDLHRYILRVLEAVAGNKTAAARILGVGRKTLDRKLERDGYAD